MIALTNIQSRYEVNFLKPCIQCIPVSNGSCWGNQSVNTEWNAEKYSVAGVDHLHLVCYVTPHVTPPVIQITTAVNQLNRWLKPENFNKISIKIMANRPRTLKKINHPKIQWKITILKEIKYYPSQTENLTFATETSFKFLIKSTILKTMLQQQT